MELSDIDAQAGPDTSPERGQNDKAFAVRPGTRAEGRPVFSEGFGGRASCNQLERAAIDSYLELRARSIDATEAFRCWADTLPPEDESAWARYQEAAERQAEASLRYCELAARLQGAT